MKLERIKLVNFLSHSDTDLDLSRVSLLAIVGENGAGKSSIFDALIWCLYGKISSRGGQSDSIARYGTLETSVTVVWILNNIKYQLVRTLDSKKKTQKLELSINDQIISERKKTEVEALLSEILKIPADLYSLTSAMQQESSSFLDLKPSDRKAFLSKILQLDKYKTVQLQAKTIRNKLVNGKSNLEGQLKVVNEEISKYIGIISNEPGLRESLDETQIKHEKALLYLKKIADAKIEEKQQKIKDRSRIETSISHYEEKQLKIVIKDDQLQSLENQYSLLKDNLINLEKISTNLEEDNIKLTTEYSQLEASITTCKKEYLKIQDLITKAQSLDTTTPCPTCHQEVCNEHVSQIIKIYQDQQKNYKDKGVEHTNSKTKIQSEINTLKQNISHNKALLIQKRDEIKDIVSQKEALISGMEESKKITDLLIQLKAQLLDLEIEEVDPEIIQNRIKAEQAEKQLSSEKVAIEKEISHIEFLKTKYDELIEQKDFINTQIKELEKNIQVYGLIIDACHPQKGIPAKIIENSLTPLEKIANDILDTFPGSTKFSIYFQTLTEDNKETLQLMVRNSNSAVEKYYEQHSGGEKLRIDLALRVALIRMVSSIYGVENRTLIIDEGFHSLSTDIRSAAFELLARLHGVWFDKILVITHSNEISDCVPFKLELKKDKDKTIIGYKNF